MCEYGGGGGAERIKRPHILNIHRLRPALLMAVGGVSLGAVGEVARFYQRIIIFTHYRRKTFCASFKHHSSSYEVLNLRFLEMSEIIFIIYIR